MYLGGQGASRTVSIKVGGNTSANFTVANVGTNTTEPKATDTGFRNLTTALETNSSSVSVGFATNGLTYYGRYALPVDTASLWGECEYYVAPTPAAPSASSIGDNSFIANHTPADTGGTVSATGYIEVYSNPAFSGSPVATVTSGSTVSGLSPSTTYYMRAYAVNAFFTSRKTTGSYPVTTTGQAAPTAPTSFTATTNRTDGVFFSWSGSTGTITSYGIWWGSQPSDSNTPDFTINTTSSSGTFLDTLIAENSGRYYWIRAQNSVGNSSWFPANSTGVYGFRVGSTLYTTTFNANGGTFFDGTTANKSVTQSSFGASITAPTISRSGHTFNGWYSSTSGGSLILATNGGTYTPTSSMTVYAQWTANYPVFSDQSITNTGTLAKDISTNPDRTVTASPVVSYSIIYSGTGIDPTSWLSINSSGQLSGVPPQVGVYTFVVRAANNGFTTDTSELALTIYPAGKRIVGSGTSTTLSVAKRFNGSGWVNLKVMKRFNGTSWVDISNI